VIYVVRDPRDVIMSQYHYQIKRGVLEQNAPLDHFVSRFIKGEVCPYGSWGENVGSWTAIRRDDPNFLLLRYEDVTMSADSELGFRPPRRFESTHLRLSAAASTT
jgi:hypothetical protein